MSKVGIELFVFGATLRVANFVMKYSLRNLTFTNKNPKKSYNLQEALFGVKNKKTPAFSIKTGAEIKF